MHSEDKGEVYNLVKGLKETMEANQTIMMQSLVMHNVKSCTMLKL